MVKGRQQPRLASVGVAHTQSLDDNHGHQYRVWPRPIAAPGYENNWLDYGYGRYAGLTIPGFPQGEFTGQDGNALPSAFIDDVNPSGDKYLRFFADTAAKKWPLWGSLKSRLQCL